jgi:hypothetical protein
MWETDDRLAGDPVWELFPSPVPEDRKRPLWPRLATAAILTALGVWLYHPLAVVTVCIAVAWGDFRQARKARRTILDRSAARISARFTYGWALWKVGMTGLALMFALVLIEFPRGDRMTQPPAAFIAAVLLWMGGSAASAFVTAAGLLAAIRSGMRVWVGQGVNQARTLLLSMLIVGFTAGVVMPLMMVMVFPRTGSGDHSQLDGEGALFLAFLFGSMIVGPVVLLLILDAVSKRVIADTPTKFGPKVAAVGKWSKPDQVKSGPSLR